MLNEDELANLFMYLREKKNFSKVGTGEEYCSDVKDGFYGAFWTENLRDGRYIIYYNDEEGDFQNVGPLAEQDLKIILVNERKINDQILEIKMKIKELMEDLASIARACDGDAERIHVLNSHNATLQLEMSTNHFDFFKDFIKSL